MSREASQSHRFRWDTAHNPISITCVPSSPLENMSCMHGEAELLNMHGEAERNQYVYHIEFLNGAIRIMEGSEPPPHL